jgi:hypothetical protein
LFGLGEYTQAHAHLEQVISFYEPRQHHHLFLGLHPADAGVSALAYDTCCLWCLGYPDQALSRSQETLALARGQGHPFTLADVLAYGRCMFHSMRRDAQALKEDAEELMEVSKQQGLWGWFMTGVRPRGEALSMMGGAGRDCPDRGTAGDQAGPRLPLVRTLGHLAKRKKGGKSPEKACPPGRGIGQRGGTGEPLGSRLHRLRETALDTG